jgi:hypothetical protein
MSYGVISGEDDPLALGKATGVVAKLRYFEEVEFRGCLMRDKSRGNSEPRSGESGDKPVGLAYLRSTTARIETPFDCINLIKPLERLVIILKASR